MSQNSHKKPVADTPADAQNPGIAVPGVKSRRGLMFASLAALGVVFGDIGTSPLYALRECFSERTNLAATEIAVLGTVSVVFWTLILVVCIKYVFFLMRADNNGEGGVLALMALLDSKVRKNQRASSVLAFCGILGAALLFGDGAVTPAISVMSAIEGLNVATDLFKPYIVPMTIVVLSILFAFQRKGTQKIGIFFGPVLFLWFLTLAALGLHAIIQCPQITFAVDPRYAFNVLLENPGKSMLILGAVFLTVTGAEVFYADMGHFERRPIRFAWFVLVFPALLLNYFGQGAYLLRTHEIPPNLFYALVPRPYLMPMVVLSTIATIIASQAVIAGAFSLTRQALQLGFWPRVRIVHTSHETVGQIYVPSVNLALWLATVALVLYFKESGNLAGAYGIAVSGTMLVTTALALVVATRVWRLRAIWVAGLAVLFIPPVALFFCANIIKVKSGGWAVITIAVAICIMMSTWRKGRGVLRKKVETRGLDMPSFVESLRMSPPYRVKGAAVFLAGSAQSVPSSLIHNLKHNKILHETTIIATILTKDVPLVPASERTGMEQLGDGVWRVIFQYGFSEIPDLRAAFANLTIPGVSLNMMNTTFFLGRETLIYSKLRTMLPLQKRIFRLMARNALTPSDFFDLPPNRVVELGLQIEL